MFLLVKKRLTFSFTNANIIGDIAFILIYHLRANPFAIRKHFHHQEHVADLDLDLVLISFRFLGNALNMYHIKLKKSVLVLKSKTIIEHC